MITGSCSFDCQVIINMVIKGFSNHLSVQYDLIFSGPRNDTIAIDKWCTVLADRSKCIETCKKFGDKV